MFPRETESESRPFELLKEMEIVGSEIRIQLVAEYENKNMLAHTSSQWPMLKKRH